MLAEAMGIKAGSSRSPYGKPCAPAPAGASAHSTASRTGFCRTSTTLPALRLGQKDMRLATEAGPRARRTDAACQIGIDGALNRGRSWENRDSRSPMLLQLERCGLKVEVDPRRIQECSTAIRRTMADQSAGDANMCQ